MKGLDWGWFLSIRVIFYVSRPKGNGVIMEQDQRFPTAMALVMARAAKRVAGKHGDLGLARAAKKLEQEAHLAIKNRQSELSVRPEKKDAVRGSQN